MSTSLMEPDAHHFMGVEMNQQVWRLLGQDSRDEKDKRRMEHFALASLHHWERSPKYKPINAQRGHWLISRVYAVLERGEEAFVHAEHCMTLTAELELGDFDLAYAHEAVARAHAAGGNAEDARSHHRRAMEAGTAIAGDEDRKMFMSDLAGQPWFGMTFGAS